MLDDDDDDDVALVALCRKLGIPFEQPDPYPSIAAELTRRGQRWGRALDRSFGGPHNPADHISKQEIRSMLIRSAQRKGYIVASPSPGQGEGMSDLMVRRLIQQVDDLTEQRIERNAEIARLRTELSALREREAAFRAAISDSLIAAQDATEWEGHIPLERITTLLRTVLERFPPQDTGGGR